MTFQIKDKRSGKNIRQTCTLAACVRIAQDEVHFPNEYQIYSPDFTVLSVSPNGEDDHEIVRCGDLESARKNLLKNGRGYIRTNEIYDLDGALLAYDTVEERL